jgi:TIR domain
MELPRYRYQLVIMGPNAGRYDGLQAAAIRGGFEELGLDPSTDLVVLGGDERDAIDGRSCVAGLWFGGESTFANEPAHKETLKRVVDQGGAVIPLVEDLGRFGQLIPKELRHLNAIVWDDARVPGDVFKVFGLTREFRQAFVSYKRSDSAGIARQLAHQLFDRGYQVFLDTASVERGVPFQEVLHERLADIDVVVLLDSPHALDSVWVHEELDLIHQLGLGVLQLFWTEPSPGDPENPAQRKLKPTKGTEFSIRFPLEEGHFVDPSVTLGPEAMLKPDVLRQVADRAEQARIRSLGSRRLRVVSYLRAEAERLGLEVDMQAAGPVYLRREGKVIATAYPVIGIPNAGIVDALEQRIAGGPEFREKMQPGDYGPYRIVFDGLGILDRRLGHLNWLNSHLDLRTLRTELLQDWLTSHG